MMYPGGSDGLAYPRYSTTPIWISFYGILSTYVLAPYDIEPQRVQTPQTRGKSHFFKEPREARFVVNIPITYQLPALCFPYFVFTILSISYICQSPIPTFQFQILLLTMGVHEAINERHVNRSGQLEAELIGQSAAAIAGWHDCLCQSTKIYRALQGSQRRIW